MLWSGHSLSILLCKIVSKHSAKSYINHFGPKQNPVHQAAVSGLLCLSLTKLRLLNQKLCSFEHFYTLTLKRKKNPQYFDYTGTEV